VVLDLPGGLELDMSQFELRRDGTTVPMEPQAFDVLAYLISHRDRLVSKEELMDAVWGGRFVTEAAVTSRIKQARRAVGDDGQAQRLIRTVHGRGYRFVAPATTRVEAATSLAGVPEQRDEPPGAPAPVRYTTSDGLHIAYQVSGGGDIDIVLIPGFVSHLELDWADPRHAHFLHRLGGMGRLIRFDKRGTGMSDRPAGVPDLETRMHDVLAVMDAVRSRRAVLCGYSEGGPMSILMAATHPERVSSLVLYGCYAKRIWSPDYPWGQTDERRRAYTDELVNAWDWEADMRMRCPSADVPMQRWWAQRMRASATPSTVRALMDMNALLDVREALPAVRVPTLVVHRTGDPMFRTEEAQFIAAHIPDARLELLDGDDHFVSGNPDQILNAFEPFLTAVRRPPPQPLALAAVITVAGESTETVVHELVEWGGRLGSTAAGQVVVLFDGPATAVRAALATRFPGSRIGLSVAEVPRSGQQVDGPAVRLSIALAAAAPPGGLWVSETVGVLLAGSGVVLEPVGNRELGPDEEQPVLRVVPG
jgi:pimeloyl-ACP methyl ester carboxylesterase/DNA-binding winged helix-turn-helix (wHTH) protein